VIRFSGRFRSAIVIGLQGIRAHKTRTFLSMVSLFLGVLAIVTVQAGSEIAERSFLTQTELSQGRDGTLQMYLGNPKAVPVALETLRGRSDGVALTSTNVIIGEPGVRPVNPAAAPSTGAGSTPRGAASSATGVATATAAATPRTTAGRAARPSSSA
jgi:putative ABC transport system permease protein